LLKILVRLTAAWIAVSVVAVVLLFWHGVGVWQTRRWSSWSTTIGLVAILTAIAGLAIVGAVASYGLWKFRAGGRKAAMAYFGALAFLCLLACLKWGVSLATLIPVGLYGAPLLFLVMPQARSCCGET
jgi:hypothetical protein